MKALVVEDERDIQELISLHLRREGHDVVAAGNGEDALSAVQKQKFDLIVIDWMLPGISGVEFCRSLRQGGKNMASVLMVTARSGDSDIIEGLEAGADDYVTKPFEVSVLMARVKALLRRTLPVSGISKGDTISIGQLSLDQSAYKVFCADHEIQLTASEFKLLSALMKNQGRVLSRDMLIDLIQGEDVAVVSRTIDTHIFGLRKKIGPYADVIETIRGIGYRIKTGQAP